MWRDGRLVRTRGLWQAKGTRRDIAAAVGVDVPGLCWSWWFLLFMRDGDCLSLECNERQERATMLGMFAPVNAEGNTDSYIHHSTNDEAGESRKDGMRKGSRREKLLIYSNNGLECVIAILFHPLVS